MGVGKLWAFMFSGTMSCAIDKLHLSYGSAAVKEISFKPRFLTTQTMWHTRFLLTNAYLPTAAQYIVRQLFVQERLLLQQDQNKIHLWCTKWLMKSYIPKCKRVQS